MSIENFDLDFDLDFDQADENSIDNREVAIDPLTFA